MNENRINNVEENKSGKLGTVALVLIIVGLFTCGITTIPGIVCAIVAFIKDRHKAINIAAIALAGVEIVLGILLLTFGLVKTPSKNNSIETTSESVIESMTTDENESESFEGTEIVEDESNAETKNIEIVSHNYSTDYEGKKVLVIEYAYTNITDKAQSFTFACQDKVYQNGVECDSAVIGCDDIDTEQQLNDVLPGNTYNLKVGYKLQDNSEATVIITDLWGEETILEESIEIE